MPATIVVPPCSIPPFLLWFLPVLPPAAFRGPKTLRVERLHEEALGATSAGQEDVRATALRLGFDWKKALFGGVARIYKEYFDIEYGAIDHCPEMAFTEVPTWLEKKRIAK